MNSSRSVFGGCSRQHNRNKHISTVLCWGGAVCVCVDILGEGGLRQRMSF